MPRCAFLRRAVFVRTPVLRLRTFARKRCSTVCYACPKNLAGQPKKSDRPDGKIRPGSQRNFDGHRRKSRRPSKEIAQPIEENPTGHRKKSDNRRAETRKTICYYTNTYLYQFLFMATKICIKSKESTKKQQKIFKRRAEARLAVNVTGVGAVSSAVATPDTRRFLPLRLGTSGNFAYICPC